MEYLDIYLDIGCPNAMKTLDYTGKFKKDLKRIRRRGWQEEKLKHIVHMLRLGNRLDI